MKTALVEGVGLRDGKEETSKVNGAIEIAVKTDDDGAMGQVKAMVTNSMGRDEYKVKKGVEVNEDYSQ